MLWVALCEPPYLQPIGIDTGVIFDRVAVHPTLNIYNGRHLDGTWTVTHLVSGRSIEDRLPDAATALDLARQLDGLPEMGYHRNVVRRSPRVHRIVGLFRERILQ